MNPADDMEENRRDKNHAIDPVEYAAMTLNHRTHILDTNIALDIADNEVTELTADADDQSRNNQVPGQQGILG